MKSCIFNLVVTIIVFPIFALVGGLGSALSYKTATLPCDWSPAGVKFLDWIVVASLRGVGVAIGLIICAGAVTAYLKICTIIWE